MHILVVGGAGYIGSHMVKMLAEQGHEVRVFDNISTGYREAVMRGTLIKGDLNDPRQLDELFGRFKFDGVMHFASFIQVGESVSNPLKYYQNNLSGGLNLLNSMYRHDVNNLIFSSSAAVYGEPQEDQISESHPLNPINPYGWSKMMLEQILADYSHAYGINSVSLRYFNAAGADPDGEIGECHQPETHLIPLVLQAASGRRESVKIFGRDYNTFDGTCVRDYIHVVDLCSAHLQALEYLQAGCPTMAFNLGNGNGFSVQEIINCAQRVTGLQIKAVDSSRREGDPASLVANSHLARRILGWSPVYNSLETIIRHAWQWERKLCGMMRVSTAAPV